MIRRPPRSTRTDPLFPYTTLFRSRATRTADSLFAAIAQRIQLGEKIGLIELLPDEQLQRSCIDLGRNRPALAGEFLLHHGIEINGETGQDHQADNGQIDRTAQPGASASGAASGACTGGARSSHGGAFYALCPRGPTNQAKRR